MKVATWASTARSLENGIAASSAPKSRPASRVTFRLRDAADSSLRKCDAAPKPSLLGSFQGWQHQCTTYTRRPAGGRGRSRQGVGKVRLGGDLAGLRHADVGW